MTFIRKFQKHIPLAVILITMFFLMLFSSIKDTATADEPAHIPAGYTYLKYQDYRLNIEHPPGLKAISALPLLLNSKDEFPKEQFFEIKSNFWGNQWGMGVQYLYHNENSPIRILLLSRIPMMLISLLFGLFIYIFVQDIYGRKSALFALALYSFSPTILAHSRLVTTDLGIAFASFCVIVSFGYMLKTKYQRKWVLLTSLSIAFAFLSKFSAVTLLPVLALMFFWDIFSREKITNIDIKGLIKNIKTLFTIFLGAGFIIYLFYALIMFRTPTEIYNKQISEVFISNIFNLKNIFTDAPVFLRPITYYITGFAYVFRHTTGGHLSFFLGNITSTGVWFYFPVIIFFKTQLVFWIFLLIAACKRKLKFNIFEVGMVSFIVLYLLLSMKGSLNIGIRHVIPVMVFLFILASSSINVRLMGFKRYLFGILIILYVLPSVISYPHFISYSNIMIPKEEKYRFFGDSNLDWGQDLKRLSEYLEQNNINDIKVDYFGGGIPVNYYIPSAQKWTYLNGLPKSGYLAVSATHLQFSRRYESEYDNLWNMKPFAQIGNGSILIYKF